MSQTYSPCGDGFTKSKTATRLPKLAAKTSNNAINIIMRTANVAL